MTSLLVAIPLAPLASFAVLVAFGRKLGRAAAYVAIAAITTSAALSAWAFSSYLSGGVFDRAVPWLAIGSVMGIFGVRLDALSALMLLVVTIVSLLVHVYSIGYMHGEKRYGAYFAYLSLFSAAMLMLILADNFLWLFISWELVGVCSYLLIGYYVDRPAAGDAAKKAFITTRIGDLGLLLAVLALHNMTGSFRYTEVFARLDAASSSVAPAVLAVVGLLLFAGAVGKSAQFPLHVWLPDAMEGPTTASALIHAATMVAAGVYLVARAYPIISRSPAAMATIAFVGLFTSFAAATIALTQTDAKRVLAYSTISQLGLMFVALGTGALAAGIFHLMTHAFFKALLFLAIGSVIHATGEQEIDKIGGLAPHMKLTAGAFAFGALALAAIPPFSGFWSKEEIIAHLFATGRYWMFAAALLISFLTALYIWRLGFLVIFAPRGRSDAASIDESPPVMTVPLLILAAAALGAGFVGSPFAGGALQKFLGETAPYTGVVPTGLSLVAAGAGVALAWWGYGKGVNRLDKALKRSGGLYRAAANRYYVDEAYAKWIVGPVVALARVTYERFDKGLIDGTVDGIGTLAGMLGSAAGKLQSGRVRAYAAWMAAGAATLAVVMAVVARR